MDLWNRMLLLWDSPVGMVTLAVFFLLLLLIAAYAYLHRKKRKEDILAFRYERHFHAAEALAKEVHFIGPHRVDFFGRKSRVKLSGGSYAHGIIPAPLANSEEVLQRFAAYMRGGGMERRPHLSHWAWTSWKEFLIGVQEGCCDEEGRSYPNLTEVLLDKALTRGFIEKFLINVSKALASIHQQRGEGKEASYHGFLTPHSIYLCFSKDGKLKEAVLANHGLAYAFGSKGMDQLLRDLEEGKLLLEAPLREKLLEQRSFLAPEGCYGAPSDFYSFGALAYFLFTGQSHRVRKKVGWESVPPTWRAFIAACLEKNPQRRPQDFSCLEELLNDPELALFLDGEQAEENEQVSVPISEDSGDLLCHVATLRKMKGSAQEEKQEGIQVEERLFRAEREEKKKRWSVAERHYQEALGLDPACERAILGLALAVHRQGRSIEAQKQYLILKEKFPKLAQRFRKEITFSL